ncbi:MAG TPA: hypothetical protein VJN18_14795 [Polyangiaceae bacterium]|nr:hypothetical protein [Polyangiaceae bacterium]
MPVERSELITCLAEAREYYAAKLAGARTVTVQRSGSVQRVTIVFEADGTHVYSEAVKPGGPVLAAADAIERRIPIGGGRFRVEQRRFSLGRARLLDEVLRAISLFTVAVPEAGGRPGYQKAIVYGPALPSGERMRVVLRPGPGDARTCVSAYPVSQSEWVAACRLKRARFP